MDIADVEAALDKVNQFAGLLQQHEPLWRAYYISNYSAPPQMEQIESQIQRSYPVILRIADRADAEIAAKLRQSGPVWRWSPVLEAAQQLVGSPKRG